MSSGHKKAPMMTVLRNRNFALLWWGGLVSMTGNWMLFVALPMYVYQTTGSTFATSLMFITSAVPRILLGWVAGVFVDRWERKRTMVICNLLLALTITPLLLVPITEAVWLVYLVALFQSSIGQFFGPAENAFLPTLVDREQLTTANALNALNNNLARLVGPALGGLVVSHFGLGGVVLFDVASYLMAALLIAWVNVTSRSRSLQEPSAAKHALAQWWSEWREGLELIRHHRVIVLILLVMALTSIGEGVFGVLLAPFVSEVFAGGTVELGWLMSAQAVGGIAGGVVIGWLGSRIAPMHLLGLGMLWLGLIDLVIVNYPLFLPTILPALVLMVAVGVPAAGAMAALLSLVQAHVTDDFRGRVFGVIGTVSSFTMLLGMLMAGLLGDALGTMLVINIQPAVYIAAGFLVLSLMVSLQNPEEAAGPTH